MSSRLVRLMIIGTAAGAFSTLFGVGGGTVIVPLLILWFAYGERAATGTSLAAIVGIAVMAVAVQAFYGNVDVLTGILIGLPAIGGAVVGVAVQQRIPERAVSIGFGLFLLVSAAVLVF